MNTKQDTTDFQSVLDTLRDNGQPPIEGNGIVVLNDVSSTDLVQEPLFEAFSEQEKQTYDLAIQMIRIYGILPIFRAIQFGEWADDYRYNPVKEPLQHFMMAVERAAFALSELERMPDSEIDMFYSRTLARYDSREMTYGDYMAQARGEARNNYKESLKMYLIKNAYDLITEHDHGDVKSIEVLPENNHPANKHALALMQKIHPDEMCKVEENKLVPWVKRITPDQLYLLQLMQYGYKGQHEALVAWRRDRKNNPIHSELYKMKHEMSSEEAMEYLNVSDYFLYQQTPVQGAVVLLDNLLWKYGDK